MTSDSNQIDLPDNGDSPDLRGPAVIVEGSVLGGFDFIGPFATIDAACQWWSKTWKHELNIGCTIVLLQEPTDRAHVAH